MRLIAIILFSNLVNLVVGQQIDLDVIATSGETFKTASLQLDWTLGEVFVDFYEVQNNSLNQGIHQNLGVRL